MDAQPLVSVIMPLHNGAATVEHTLETVCAQTWRNLEIIVVDDGSTDDGPARVQAIAAREPRLQLVQQPNAGVAAARNRGAETASAEYFAFIDADDLWAPEKIELQMAAMRAGGEPVGLVYTWSALIDERDRIYSLADRPEAEGRAFRNICRGNFVGNGSTPMIRRAAFEQVGGYDPSLRARGAQGCEDLMIYMRLAEQYELRVVRRFLTGYRVTRGNMSSNALSMLRSCELCLETFRPRYPEYEPEFRAHRVDMFYWLLARAVTTGPLSNAVKLLAQEGPAAFGEVGPRLPQLAVLLAKAHAPARVKALLRQALKQPELRPAYLEAAV